MVASLVCPHPLSVSQLPIRVIVRRGLFLFTGRAILADLVTAVEICAAVISNASATSCIRVAIPCHPCPAASSASSVA